jgi:hypothetical protein
MVRDIKGLRTFELSIFDFCTGSKHGVASELLKTDDKSIEITSSNLFDPILYK